MLALHHVSRSFGATLAVDTVSLTVGERDVLALLGPNGAGKTTLLRLMAGLIAPSEGSVTIDGRAAGHPAAASRIGVLPEAPGLWDGLTVDLNLRTYARLHALSDVERAVGDAIDRFALREVRYQTAATLSKGTRQKVALARALLHEPRLLLLDEPTSGLDPTMGRELRGLIQELRDEGRAIVVSTHNLDEAERVATRVAVLDRRVLAFDTPEELTRRFHTTRLRVRLAQPEAARFVALATSMVGGPVADDGETLSCGVSDPLTDAPRILRALVGAGADIVEATLEHATLEDVYVALVGRASRHGDRPA